MADRKRIDPARRQRNARDDGSVGSLQRTIGKTLGLDPNSVKLVRPDGRKKRKDASVKSLSKDYE